MPNSPTWMTQSHIQIVFGPVLPHQRLLEDIYKTTHFTKNTKILLWLGRTFFTRNANFCIRQESVFYGWRPHCKQ